MVKQLIDRCSDFSSSESKPLFWMLMGPLLVMLTLILAIPTLSNPFLPLITVMGVVVSWRYRVSGFAFTLMVFILYFALHYFLGHREAFLWKVGWGCSLALGLTVSFLCMEELKAFYSKEKEHKDKVVSELRLSLYSSEEKGAVEKRGLEREMKELKEQHKSLQDEIEVLLSLVEGSRIESEKMFKQRDLLSSESLSQYREIQVLKQELKSVQEREKALHDAQESLMISAKERLKMLNTARVELYQSRLLVESYEKQLKRAREYFLSQKQPKAAPPKKEKPQASPPLNDRGQQLILQTLEKDKGMIKKIYDQIQEDFQTLKKALEEGKAKMEKAPDEESDLEVKKLGMQVVEKKKKLEQTKAELIGIEREIFVIKKGLQEKGAFAQS